jgi:hypothetical protein
MLRYVRRNDAAMNRRVLLTTTAAAIAGLAMWRFWPTGAVEAKTFEISRSDAEWRKLLTPAQYEVLRNHGTERPFTSPLDAEKRKGIFACAGCDLALFSSETKYDSRTGWPSFYAPLPDAIGTQTDYKAIDSFYASQPASPTGSLAQGTGRFRPCGPVRPGKTCRR